MRIFLCMLLIMLIPSAVFADFHNVKNENISLKNVKKGDIIRFGIYPQTADCKVKPIDWIVLEHKDNKVLVISKYGLNAKKFDDESSDWYKSNIRKWLNGPFADYAFKKDPNLRKSFIPNPETGDFVSLISYEESKKYFKNDDERICAPTDYVFKDWPDAQCSSCTWWLRTRVTNYEGMVRLVASDGSLMCESQISDSDRVVRPIIWLSY